MIRVSFLDILKNFLILIPWVRNMAKKHHKTGIQNRKDMVDDRISDLSEIMRARGMRDASVVEIGPGQTSGTIAGMLKTSETLKVYAVDVTRYFPDSFWLDLGVEFLYRNTSSLQDNSVDFVYCYDVLEHVKDPHAFLCELRRVIGKNGFFFASWDLRDHMHLNSESDWFDMHKYSEIVWNLQMSNRSSYVNRLTYKDWIEAFRLSGFEVVSIETIESNIAATMHEKEYGVRIDPTYRVKALLTPTFDT